MEIKNSTEIISDILDRYGFTVMYKDGVMPVAQTESDVRLDRVSAVDFLLAGALTGKKAIGFFSEIPRFKVKYLLRGECIFVTTKLPDRISVPVIFCREPEEVSAKLLIALKVSLDSKLPVVLVVSDNTYDNFAPYERVQVDVGRAFAYLGSSSFETRLDRNTFTAALETAYDILSEAYPKNAFDVCSISFNNPDYEFFEYVLPLVTIPLAASLAGSSISVPENEVNDIDAFLDACEIKDFTIVPVEVASVGTHKEFMCPGCPVVAISNKLRGQKDTLVFTDLSCKGILEAFEMKYVSYDTYTGLAMSGLNVPTIFVGSAANYKPYYDKLIKSGNVILLNDCGAKEIESYHSVKLPKKMTVNRNVLFAYGCSNIQKYGRCTVRQKRCKCILDGGTCPAIEFTKCPAISVSENKAYIDYDICTGCQICKDLCRPGAIS